MVSNNQVAIIPPSTEIPPELVQANFRFISQLKTMEANYKVYEEALMNIASITKVETAMDQSAEAFFFIASKMRKEAIKALKATGARE